MNKHFKVYFKDNSFLIGKKKFNAMHELIEHYINHPIFDQNSEKLYLIKALELPSNNNNNNNTNGSNTC